MNFEITFHTSQLSDADLMDLAGTFDSLSDCGDDDQPAAVDWLRYLAGTVRSRVIQTEIDKRMAGESRVEARILRLTDVPLGFAELTATGLVLDKPRQAFIAAGRQVAAEFIATLMDPFVTAAAAIVEKLEKPAWN